MAKTVIRLLAIGPNAPNQGEKVTMQRMTAFNVIELYGQHGSFVKWVFKQLADADDGRQVLYVPDTILTSINGIGVHDDLDIRQWLYLDDEHQAYPLGFDAICVRAELTADDFDIEVVGEA